MNLKIVLKSWNSAENDVRVKMLQHHCFSDVDQEYIEECFSFFEGFGILIAIVDDRVVGQAELFKRNIKFNGKKVVLGGIGSICVHQDMRNKGIATKLIRKGLAILKEKKCDVACLNADLSKTVYKLYEKIGFKLMKRKISFEDVHGNLRYDTGTMFIPICSKQLYNHIMKSNETFHYGKGYW
ncbi:MAG: GNAT family N-acetyltransferase [Candidatus Aenigmarchaeota archaeon]|nr:GNAT family N-acetyltransferase [Candidatus Aenigmarchaeota archaeon]